MASRHPILAALGNLGLERIAARLDLPDGQ
jgi:hypothetical protein